MSENIHTNNPSTEAYFERYRSEVFRYIRNGEPKADYKNGSVPVVYEPKLREMVLRAGRTEYALGCLWGEHIIEINHGDSNDGGVDRRTKVEVTAPNIYNLGRREYDLLDATTFVVDSNPPDYSNGRDGLRFKILKAQDGLVGVNKSLREIGKVEVPIDSWRMNSNGEVFFLYDKGYYSLDFLQKWANATHKNKSTDGKIPVRKLKISTSSLNEMYVKTLTRLSERKDEEGKRLFRITMLRASREVANMFAHHLQYLNRGN